MKFDVKDVKSWANRKDVKIGAEGYFCHDINKLINNENEYIKPVKSKLSAIRDNYATCFQIDNGRDGDNVFPFFLPLDAVKKEKKYRPFKDLYEFYDFLSISPFKKENFHNEYLLKFSFTYREKILPQIATMTIITRIDVGLDNDPFSIFINKKDLKDWFDNFEIMNNKGEWVPFGVEVKND